MKKTMKFWTLFLILAVGSTAAFAEDVLSDRGADSSPKMDSKNSSALDIYSNGPSDVSAMEYWDVAMGMAMPLPMAGMPMRMLMLHGYGFGTMTAEEGPRGRADFASPNMFMADIGTSVGDVQYLNLDVMLTAELWTVAKDGYPELYQIGEDQADGSPFLDAQHPHSSPLMGLTLSDTLALGGKDNLKLFAAPRGESTDGPIAFMHRVTGMVNPDAPLGHHIGQDVGHVSSTVLGESLKLGDLHFESSLFHGAEPDPTSVDLPIGSLDSFGLRMIYEISPDVMAMASYAYVSDPEPGILKDDRYSASLYTRTKLSSDWLWHNTFIFGYITDIDHAPNLSSALYEFLLNNGKTNLFGRFEAVQRTPNQLEIPDLPNPNEGRWVTAVTLGFSRQLAAWDGWELRSGASVTNDQSPAEFSAAYGGNPFTYKFFIELGGTQMIHL